MQVIQRDQVQQLMQENDNVAVVEVLGEENFQEYHLPGAINVPIGERFEENIEQALPNKDKKIVVYCLDKSCEASPKAAQKMEELGYQNVFDYEEGKVDWKQAGLPVEK